MRNLYSIAKVGLALVALTLGSTLAAPLAWGAPAESMLTQAAQSKVKGRVVDEKGDALVGVKVLDLGSRTATMTDVEGNFQINAPQGAQLEYSYVGYKTKVVPVSGNVINVTLAEEAQAIDQVVVVGYGTQKKVNMTGSVASVNVGEMLDSRPVTNVSQALAGMAAGVSVTSTNNRPSNNNAADITIRGNGTLNNSAPLIIIDGVESSLNTLNPSDIATISILKDAASASIYGSRAANGVVLVTTKKGREGKMSLSYDGYVSFESMNKNFSMVSKYADYMEILNEGFKNSGAKTPQFSQATIDLWRKNENNPTPWLYPNNDIMDFYTTGVAQQHNITVSGGSDKITYYTSFGYLNNPGVLPLVTNTGYERFNLRSNVEGKITKWLTVGTNLSGYSAQTSIASDNIDDSYTYALSGGNPGVAWMDDQGRLGINANTEDDPQNAVNNPYLRFMNVAGDITTLNAKARLYAILTPVKGLTIQGSYNFEYYNQAKNRKPKFVEMWNFQTDALVTDGVSQTSIMNRDLKQYREFMDGTIRYENNDWANGNFQFSILGGASQEQFKETWFQASKVDLIDPALWVIDAATGEASASGNGTAWAMRSFFGRLNLGWKNKYLLEANFRADASSRFAPDNRWGYFPSFSGAWIISQEQFMQNVSWLNMLKIRGSWGALGNNSIGNYDWQSTYSQTNYVLNRTVAMGLAMRNLANSGISWETTYVTSVAAEFGMFNNRFTGTIEYFNKLTDGILIALPAPAVAGTATIPKQNAAQVTNQGVEVTLGWTDRKGEFQYSINGNFTYVKNKVDKFKGDVPSYSTWTMLLEGQPMNVNNVLHSSGIVETQEQLDKIQYMINNAPFNDPKDLSKGRKNPFASYGIPQKGDLMYEDLNGDGIVNADDRYMVGTGSVTPITYGLNFNCAWKGIDFSILFQGMYGLHDPYLSALYQPVVRLGYQVNADIADGRWSDGRETAARYPRLLAHTDARNTQASDFWLMERNYFKIRNVQLGYTLPRKWLDAIKMQKIRLYVSLENFFTLSDWKGFDPEYSGIAYPSMKQALVGLNLTF